MADLLIRRREMVIPFQQKEWDYEWDASKGLPNNNGFTKATSGGSVSLASTYLQFNGTSSSYTSYVWPTDYLTGVIEAELYSSSQAQMRLYFGNGTYGVGIRLQTSSNYKGVYWGTSVSTKLVSASADTKYKVRLVLKGDVADVYVNDVIKATDKSVTDLTNCAHITVWGGGSGSATQKSRLYSLKMKFGRTS